MVNGTVPNPSSGREFLAGVADYGVLTYAEQIVRRTVVAACACGLPRSDNPAHWCDANGGRWTAWPITVDGAP